MSEVALRGAGKEKRDIVGIPVVAYRQPVDPTTRLVSPDAVHSNLSPRLPVDPKVGWTLRVT